MKTSKKKTSEAKTAVKRSAKMARRFFSALGLRRHSEQRVRALLGARSVERGIPQPSLMLIPLDDIPAHPYAVAVEAAMLAPKSEVSMIPWKEPRTASPDRAPNPFLPPRPSPRVCVAAARDLRLFLSPCLCSHPQSFRATRAGSTSSPLSRTRNPLTAFARGSFFTFSFRL